MTAQDNAISPTSFDEFHSQLQGSALKATRNSISLPADITFHRSMDAEFAKDLDAFSSRVLEITNKILTLVGTAAPSGKGKGRLECEEDVVDKFESLVVDSMDSMMERTDMSLDEFLGRNKAPAIAINIKPVKSQKAKGKLDSSLQHASHLAKPQLKFKTKVDNSDSPWYPNLPHKYNAQVPLGYNLHDESSESQPTQYHPYRYEITHISYPSHMFRSAPPIPPTPFESTTFKWVSNKEELQSMVDELRKATEIAVDLEHHDYRSYGGFLCLMQISTREQDWILDLLVLREELAILNEVFTDSKIVKVLHGAESDIVWLQQDLSLYIVNLFDTFHASKVLGFPRHGLANLLEMYCDFTPDKRYQLADWRIRPLPEEMLEYARSDTHFLLYIYDNLRNALLDRAQSQSPPLPPAAVDNENNEQTAASSSSAPAGSVGSLKSDASSLVHEVLSRSEETALRVYEKEIYDAEGGSGSTGWDTLAKKWNKVGLYASASGAGIPGMQREVYKRVHMWRDKVAREEDESTRYVLPNHYIFQLAEQPPADMPAMLRIFNSVPPVLRRRAKELLDVIREGVKAHLSLEANARPVEPPADVMSVDDTPTSNKAPGQQEEAKVAQDTSTLSSLWTLGSLSSRVVPIKSKSSLFGALSASSVSSRTSRSQHERNHHPKLIASKSALFGDTVNSSLCVTAYTRNDKRFSEVVARIHSTLVIAPTIAVSKDAAKIEQKAAEEPEEGVLPASVQVEIPFVPASQRQRAEAGKATNGPGSATTADDSIVVVGQARQKKRKRTKAVGNGNGNGNEEPSADGEGTMPSPKRTKVEKKAKGARVKSKNEEVEEEVEPFDFESAPSILDVVPAVESAIPKTRKVKQGKGGFYGDFPAPPKALSELKSGNKSHTFK